MTHIAFILAGGSGQRAGGSLPKQFWKVNGKTILEYSLESFHSISSIDEMVLITHPAWRQTCEGILAGNRFPKIRHLIDGGRERYLSVLAALKLYEGQSCHLLIHDAVRPLVTRRIIEEVIASLQKYGAVNVAIPATDTIIEVDPEHNCISRIPDRSRLYQVQTPQGFHNEVLQKAYRQALQDPHFKTTDDCGVVKRYLPKQEIKIVPGDITNLKLTYQEDLILIEQLLKNRGIECAG